MKKVDNDGAQTYRNPQYKVNDTLEDRHLLSEKEAIKRKKPRF